MTIADEARDNSISCEMVKYAYRQTKDGVVVSFVVHPNDVPAELSTSHIGSRYVAVLVQIGDDEMPITPAAKEKPKSTAAKLQPDQPDKPRSAGAKRDWRDVQPAAQAGIRSNEPIFWAFLNETRGYAVENATEAAEAIRELCNVQSRVELGTDHRKRVLWHQLDKEFDAWKTSERVGA